VLTATHAILLRFDTPIRVCRLGDAAALLDMRVAASLSIGIYTVAEVDPAAAERAEDRIAGRRAAAQTMAGWRLAA
jgi:hypothetical protein